MADNKLKETVLAVTLPDDARNRISKNLHRETARKQSRRKHPITAPIAAALVLCLCLPLGVAAAGFSGQFKDVTNWFGAVVSTKYEGATEEIDAAARVDGSTLTVTATFLLPKEAPYAYIEALSIGSYTITDSEGRVLAKGEDTASAALDFSQAQILIPLDISLPEGCILKIHTFTAHAKAEQPLPISGSWEIPVMN